MEPRFSDVHIAIFASGAGSNAQRIIEHFRNHAFIRVSLVVSNKPGAGVITLAEKENITVLLIEKERFFHGDGYADVLQEKKIGFIVLAGFLWKFPDALIKKYAGQIINIHPALLPEFGGRGMFGKHVHEAVIAAKKKTSGITIHYVDELYDHGEIIAQVTCEVDENDTAESLAQKIHTLEHEWFPRVIEELIVSKNIVKR